jgi:uncharacterized integral membrane protein (TIGR00697 family)
MTSGVAVLNVFLFLSSCALIACFAWWFCRMGQGALTAWMAMLSLTANLFVLKQIDLFGLNATASDVFAIGGLLSLNLLREKYGKEAASNAIWTSFACLLFFVLMSQVHLLYVPSHYDTAQFAYEKLLSASPRLLIASLVTFLVVDQFDSHLYGTLRKKYPKISMWFISGMTLSVSQLIDTVLFSLLGLYGLVHAIFNIILVSYGVKLLAIMNTLPWTYFSQKLFKHHADPLH